jgi:hypothetical protein
MKFMKRESSLALVMLLVALLTLPSLLGSNAKKVEASGQQIGTTAGANDVKPRVKTPRGPHIPNGAAPANDNCANAITVTCPTFTDTQNTSGAGIEVGEPETCTLVGATVWYTYTNNTGNAVIVNISTCDSAPLDTTLDVFKVNGGPCDFANFDSVACNDDSLCGDGFQSQASFTADPGATYKIQVGGFDGDTGTMNIDITCQELTCPPITVNGALGLGSPDYPSTSGQQTPARLFRDGVASTCAAPKPCPGPFGAGSFTYDAYTFTNDSGEEQCVTIAYDPDSPANPVGVNAHAIAYLNSFSPTNLCLNYLGDVGSSLAQPFSVTVPADSSLVVVIAANNPGGVGNGQNYKFSVIGNICAGFDVCVQQDSPRRFLQFSTTTGAYRYTDCSKNIVREGTGTASMFFCKTDFSGSGPGSTATALVNPCTLRGDATIRLAPTSPFGLPQTVRIIDTNITNNDCECGP